LKLMPTLPKRFFTVPPQVGQTEMGSSVKDWTASNSWLQSLQRYS